MLLPNTFATCVCGPLRRLLIHNSRTASPTVVFSASRMNRANCSGVGIAATICARRSGVTPLLASNVRPSSCIKARWVEGISTPKIRSARPASARTPVACVWMLACKTNCRRKSSVASRLPEATCCDSSFNLSADVTHTSRTARASSGLNACPASRSKIFATF